MIPRGSPQNALNGRLSLACRIIFPEGIKTKEIVERYMGSSETETTTIPVRKQDHRRAKEVKRDGETWSLFLRRATEMLDSETHD